MLAGVPKEPEKYQPMIKKNRDKVKPDDYVIDDSDPLYTLIYNPECEDRYKIVILLLKIMGISLKKSIKPQKIPI